MTAVFANAENAKASSISAQARYGRCLMPINIEHRLSSLELLHKGKNAPRSRRPRSFRWKQIQQGAAQQDYQPHASAPLLHRVTSVCGAVPSTVDAATSMAPIQTPCNSSASSSRLHNGAAWSQLTLADAVFKAGSPCLPDSSTTTGPDDDQDVHGIHPFVHGTSRGNEPGSIAVVRRIQHSHKECDSGRIEHACSNLPLLRCKVQVQVFHAAIKEQAVCSLSNACWRDCAEIGEELCSDQRVETSLMSERVICLAVAFCCLILYSELKGWHSLAALGRQLIVDSLRILEEFDKAKPF